MKYISQLNAFENWTEVNYLTATEELIWYKLLSLNNRFGWSEWFFVSNQHLMFKARVASEHTLIKARNRLKQVGLIDFLQGKKGQPTKYKITKLYAEDFTVENTAIIAGENAVNNKYTTKNAVKVAVNSAVKVAVNNAVNSADNKDIDKDLDLDNKKTSKKSSNAFDLLIAEYTSDESLAFALNEFIKMRKEIKAKLTENALSLLLKKLDKLAGCSDSKKIAILEQSILNSWKGVFALKGEDCNGKNSNWANESNRTAPREGKYDFVEKALSSGTGGSKEFIPVDDTDINF